MQVDHWEEREAVLPDRLQAWLEDEAGDGSGRKSAQTTSRHRQAVSAKRTLCWRWARASAWCPNAAKRKQTPDAGASAGDKSRVSRMAARPSAPGLDIGTPSVSGSW